MITFTLNWTIYFINFILCNTRDSDNYNDELFDFGLIIIYYIIINI